MDAVVSWLVANWFQALQSLSIVSGLVFAGCSVARDARARRVANLLSLARDHRELWLEVYRQPELHRILDPNPDLVAKPRTFAETAMVNLLLIHLSTTWQLNRLRLMLMPGGVENDIKNLFSLPIPKSVWDQTKALRDPKFARFVDQCLIRN